METETIDVFSTMPEFDDSQNNLIGKTISHYKIVEKLGEGGMGVVYRAKDLNFNHHPLVALKFLKAEFDNDIRLNERFQREASVLRGLTHVNIVKFYEFGKYQNRNYIVMEYVEGHSLKKSIAEKENLSIAQILDIMIPICQGLREAHRTGITHRDIKPENILIDKKGIIKVSDFGLAKLKDAASISLTGFLIGTVKYMSPEQANSEELDHRSDIFSLGIVLYELITYQLPFDGSSNYEVLGAIKTKAPKPLAQYREKIPDDLQRIVDKALEKNQNKRYQNIDKFLDDIDNLLIDLKKEKENFLETKTIPQPIPIPPVEKNKWRESMSNLWRKSIPYRKYFVIGGIIATILGFIVDFRELLHLLSTPSSVVSISTEPKDVEVVLNGKFIGKTPIPDTSIQAGKVSLKFSKAGYVSIDTTIAVEKGINWMLMFTLKKAPAPLPGFDSLKISSEPPRSPNLIEQLSKKKPDKIQPDNSQIIVEPPMFGKLNVLVKPFGSIYINRERRKQGTDVLYTESLPVGIYRLLVLHPEYGRWEEEINIKPNASLNITIDFNEKFIVTVTSTPVWGEIFVDGKPTGKQTSQELTLRIGQHIIEVRRDGYIADPGSRIINLKDDTKVSFSLIKL